MKKFKLNNVALVYFGISWLIGIIIILLMIFETQDELALGLLFLSAFNLIINLFSILLLFVLYYVFPENKTEFKNSAVMLFFNFPILIALYILLIYNL
ncbi:hypothetical protein DRF62_12175 [Chryseobacterium piscium]|jgi:hypothetical protein|uniref:Uncharacterized protein n=1 Tax=Chryseobacterium piscium TaxID=333702 RepID=A0A3D9BJV4_9FLAO|nr:hypothetical protein DRF62_12175 [Chryseobacterium piscium]